MREVTAADVAAFLSQGDNPELVALAGEVVPIVREMARSYTRGRGFEPLAPEWCSDGLAAVVTTASARMISNPLQNQQSVGGVQQGAGFVGWSLAELFVLNGYRKRAS